MSTRQSQRSTKRKPFHFERASREQLYVLHGQGFINVTAPSAAAATRARGTTAAAAKAEPNNQCLIIQSIVIVRFIVCWQSKRNARRELNSSSNNTLGGERNSCLSCRTAEIGTPQRVKKEPGGRFTTGNRSAIQVPNTSPSSRLTGYR